MPGGMARSFLMYKHGIGGAKMVQGEQMHNGL